MERNFEVSHQVLRELRCLFTPTSRRAVLPAMLEKAVSRKTFEEAVRVAQKEQWVEFHWSADNPLIHPAVRMFSPPPSALSVHVAKRNAHCVREQGASVFSLPPFSPWDLFGTPSAFSLLPQMVPIL